MNHDQIERIRESFKAVAPRGRDLFGRFVDRLAVSAPTLRACFPSDPLEHAQEYLSPLGLLVKNLHRLASIEYVLTDLGARNHRRGVMPQHYGAARDALLETLADGLGEAWTDELSADWAEAFNIATSLMIRGGGRARSLAA